jgi:hypothetical protein
LSIAFGLRVSSVSVFKGILMINNKSRGMVMLLSNLNGSLGAKISTEKFDVNRSAIALGTVALCVLGIISESAVARGLRPLKDRPQDADVREMKARIEAAEASGQALKFEAPNLMNLEAQLNAKGHRTTGGPKTGAFVAHNPVEVITSMIAALVAPNAVAQAAPSPPQVAGQWTTLPYLMPINPIHVNMLRTGNILVTTGTENNPAEVGVSSKAAVWWLGSGNFTEWDNMPWDLFCNGATAMTDGRILIFGGTVKYDPFYGDNRATIFDPAMPTYFPFSEVQSMAGGRWYGTATELTDGRIMAFSGDDEDGNINQTVEIYALSKATQGWTAPVTAPFTPPLYPWDFLLPNGNVFFAGGGWGGWAYQNGSQIYNSQIFNVSSQTWSASAPSFYGYPRTYGSAVLLPLLPSSNYAARVLDMGGEGPQGGGGSSTAEIINVSAANPSWQPAGNMPSGGREQMNSVLFPNGQVLALGGSVVDEDATTATYGADLYNSTTGTWTQGAPEAYARLYHNSAVLLPDGCVIVTGSNPVRGTYEQHIEIYTPPWLFDSNGNWIPWGNRPQISSAPAKIGYSGTFQVQTPNAAGANLPDVASVVLVKPGSDTHAFNFEQRVVGLNFTLSSGALTVTCPPNSNIAPPGYYMLFILSKAGVTSIASFVQVLANPTDVPPKGTITTPTQQDTASNPSDVTIQAGQSVNFTGSASSSGGTISKTYWFFPSGVPTSSTKASPGAIVFPTTGAYVASLTAVDNLGVNDPMPPLRMVTVVPDVLTATVNSPVSGSTVKGTAVSITGSATGITGTSNTFVFLVDGTSKKTVTTAAANATYSWNSTLVANGSHTLKVNVTDAKGDFGTQSSTVTVAN